MPVFKEVGDRTEKQTGVQFSKSELDILWDICRYNLDICRYNLGYLQA